MILTDLKCSDIRTIFEALGKQNELKLSKIEYRIERDDMWVQSNSFDDVRDHDRVGEISVTYRNEYRDMILLQWAHVRNNRAIVWKGQDTVFNRTIASLLPDGSLRISDLLQHFKTALDICLKYTTQHLIINSVDEALSDFDDIDFEAL